jgi:hypothetical protein
MSDAPPCDLAIGKLARLISAHPGKDAYTIEYEEPPSTLTRIPNTNLFFLSSVFSMFVIYSMLF